MAPQEDVCPIAGPPGIGVRPKRRKANENAVTKGTKEFSRALYHCNYCTKDISSTVRIKCAVCADFDLCVECFSVGVEITPHKNNHAYKVVENLSFPLYTEDWGADEELLLLEAVEMYGLGNWKEVKEHVGTKSKEECHQHYFDVYLRSKNKPLPDAVLNQSVSPRRTLRRSMSMRSPSKEQMHSRRGITPSPSPARMPSDFSKETLARATTATTETPVKEEDENEGGHQSQGGKRPVGLKSPETVKIGDNNKAVTGYHAKRNEFDPEHDPDAEVPLAEMDVLDCCDEPEVDREAKDQQLSIYYHRQQERYKRRQFVLDYGLLNVSKQQKLEKKRTREEIEMAAKFRPFARFLQPEQFEDFVERVILEHRLRTRIDELKEMRRQGITSLKEADMYEIAKQRREADKDRIRSMEAGLASGISPKSSAIRASRYLAREDSMAAAVAGPGSSTVQQRELLKLRTSGSAPSLGGTVNAYSVKTFRKGDVVDIQNHPGYELLTQKEKDLCLTNRLLPLLYFSIKEKFIRENEERGSLSRADVKNLMAVEPTKLHRVFDFMQTAGWLANK